MRLLFLQFADPRQGNPLPEFSQSMGVLAAMLKADGFECHLLTLGGYRSELLHEAVKAHRPQCVLAELTPYSVAAAHRTIGDIAGNFGLPVVAFGPFATCQPTRVVSIHGVTALLPGEYEHAAVELLRAMRDGREPAGIEGAWVRTDTGLVKGKLAPLVKDIDSFPFADREIFDYGRIVKATGEAAFKVARGCPLWCAYCINDWYMDLYGGGENFLRRRSVANVLDEVTGVLGRYEGAKSVTFYDHCFAMDADWLGEFAREYPQRCDLPYRCHVRLGSVTEQVAEMLAASNCRWVHTHVGSGSRFIREDILSIHVDANRINSSCRMLRAAGLRVAAEVFVGSPYESEITIDKTRKLLRRAEFDEVHPRVFYPTPGTRAAELCQESGWISSRGEESYWLGRSVLDMPSMPAGQIDASAQKLSRLSRRSGLRKLLDGVSRRGNRGSGRHR